MTNKKEKIVILGIDAATWDIIDPLLEKGKLPALQLLIQEGVRLNLRTIQPMISPMIWTSIASGKLPNKHGVKDFVATAHSVRSKRIWDILQENGYSMGLMEVMVTWPPQKVNGFWIPDTFARDNSTFPENLSFIKELIAAEKAGGEISPKKRFLFASELWRHGVPLRELFVSALSFLRLKFRKSSFEDRFFIVRRQRAWLVTYFFSYLYKKISPDFAFFYTNLIDTISHTFWKYYEPEKFSDLDPQKVAKYKEVIPNTYIEIDKMLNVLLKNMDEKTWIFVVSDHGFRAVQNDPTWISYRIKTIKLLDLLKLRDEVIPTHVGSTLFLRPLNRGNLTEEEIKSRILSVQFRDGSPVFAVTRDDQGYFKITVPEDVLKKINESCKVGEETLIPLKELVEKAESVVSGTHDELGILLMKGPGIKRGEKLNEASVLDITPTVLYIAGLPVAEDMDGKVILDAFTPKFQKSREVKTIKTYESGERAVVEEGMTPELEEHLRGLGYL